MSSFFAPSSRCGTPEELKELVNSDETLNHTFNKFRELQQRWKDTGIVPQQHVKDLWETYNLHVENFYSFIKINKELRDLDLKKNYEQKVALCEQAEALVLEPSVVEAFHKLQKLHDEWRETGPVANEYKEVLWERFKAASSRINKQHQEHFESLKGEQVKNLELKTELCAATEELAAQPLVILEGSYSHHPLLRPYETLRVFVTCTKAEQTQRLQAREGARYADFAARWVPLEEGYFAQYGIAENADFVVETTQGGTI